jgi:hypothetical protein
MDALRAFRDTILLWENVELRWLLGGMDCMVSPHNESHDFFTVAAAFGVASKIAYLQRLCLWSPTADAGLPSLSDIALPTQLRPHKTLKWAQSLLRCQRKAMMRHQCK